MATRESAAAIVRAMTSPNVVVRSVVAPTLGALATRDAKDALRLAANEDPDPEVRRICALLLPS
jgi:hypothetical protein